MILKVFTMDDGPETRAAKELGKKFEENGFRVEFYNSEDKEATAQLEIYDLYSFPSFVVTRADGAEIECWRGRVPLYNDIFGFLSR